MLIPIKGPEKRSYQNYIHSSKKHSRAGAEPSFLVRVKKLLAISFSTLILLQYNWASECEYTMYIYRHSAMEYFLYDIFFLKLKNVHYFLIITIRWHFFFQITLYTLMDCIEEASFFKWTSQLSWIYTKCFRSHCRSCKILKNNLLIPD